MDSIVTSESFKCQDPFKLLFYYLQSVSTEKSH